MEKQLAIKLLGGTPAKAAQAMGYRSVQAVYMWPDILTTDVADRVTGAVARIKLTRKHRSRTELVKAQTLQVAEKAA